MLLSKRQSLYATICYADLFDCPLTPSELRRWMLFYLSYHLSFRGIQKEKGFIFLKHRKKIIALRNRRIAWQQDKWTIAQRAGKWLSLVPTIQLVGVTGGLAMNNAALMDDIDLFFVAADHTLWVSRLLATILMDVMRLRRHPKDRIVANKVCLNMFMTGSALALKIKDRDCFTAHEVLQMAPIWEQPGTYKKFLAANRWVRVYLPNAWKAKRAIRVAPVCTSFGIVIFLVRLFEWPSKRLQLWYMKRHRTHEVITDTVLRFHPRDARVWVKRRLAARLRRYHIPLDNVFYAS